MTYLVDTDWVADYLKGDTSATKLLTSLAKDGLAISLISYGELYEGIYYGDDPDSSERGFRQFLRWVNVLVINRTIMKRFARIRGDLRRKGQIIGDPDILIASTAIFHDLTLITGNLKHFRRIPDLKLYQN